MKEGLTYKKLGDLATYINGYAFKPSDWKEGGLPIIRIQNLNNPDSPFNYYDGNIPEKYIVRKGDILISWSASLGAYEWKGSEALLNQHIFKVVFDKSNVDKYYLKYAVEGKLSEMLKNVHGATMQHIVKKDFDNTLVPYPSLNEQHIIVSELDLISKVIEKLKEQLHCIDNLSMSIFYNMFGSPTNQLNGWNASKLGDVVEITSKLVNPNEKPYCNQYHVGPANIVSGSGEIKDCLYAKDENLISSKYSFKSGVVLYSKIRPNLNKVAIPYFDGVCSADMYPLSVKDNAINLYIKHLLFSKEFLTYAVNCSGRARMPKINREALFEFEFFLPPISLQQEFAEKIETIEAMKKKVRLSLKESEQLYNSRMYHYFN